MDKQKEIPRPQVPKGSFSAVAEAMTNLFPHLGLGLERVTEVIDLGCGRGGWIERLLDRSVFPNVERVTAVDFHDLLPIEVKNDRRVTFVQGLLPDVVKPLKQPDLVIAANIETHAFAGRDGAQNLVNLVGSGTLVVVGDTRINTNVLEGGGLKKQQTKVPGLQVWKKG